MSKPERKVTDYIGVYKDFHHYGDGMDTDWYEVGILRGGQEEIISPSMSTKIKQYLMLREQVEWLETLKKYRAKAD